MANELKTIGWIMLGTMLVMFISYVKNNLTLLNFTLGYLLGLITYEVILYLIINEK